MKKRIARADTAIDASTIIVNASPGISVADMKTQCCGIEDLGMVVIDYPQLLDLQRHDVNWMQKIAETTLGIKNMARELQVPVVCVSQLSGALEKREDKRPTLRDLTYSGSGPLVQDSDVFIVLNRESDYRDECDNPCAAKAIVLKNRHGEIGVVPLRFIPDNMAFTSAEQ